MENISRRNLLLGLGFATAGAVITSRRTLAQNPPPLKILILGGTGFIGPHIVRRAIARGHEVTLFNRGRSNTHLFPEVEKRIGDRDGDLESLKTGRWDAVLDNSGYVPRHVRDSAELLKERTDRYLFTSSISAYDFTVRSFPLTVESKLNEPPETDSEDVGRYYGEFKAACEQHVAEIYGERATLLRPTYIVGPGDRSQRFTWWVDRIHRGGDVLAPGNPDTNASLIDVRDLADFYIKLLEDRRAGVFNVSGPAKIMSFGDMLEGIQTSPDRALKLQWVSAEFLDQQGVSESEMPMWNAFLDGMTELMVENQSTIDAGLRFRPLAETAADTLAWHRLLPPGKQVFDRAGIDPKKEATVLAAWKQHQNNSA